MKTYAPCGHLVTYSGLKPSKCPTCGASMETPSVAAIAAAIPVQPQSRPRQSWSSHEARQEPQRSNTQHRYPEFDDADMEFDAASIRVERETGRMTVKELAERGEPIERQEERASVPEGKGNKLVTTAELVNQMLATEPAVAAASAAPARKQSRPRRSRAAKGAS